MSTAVEQIKSRLGIVDVVGSYIKLEKAGANMRARCPFHNEKTPSFSVSPSRESYHCFGCGKGGDIFTFVEEIEGVDFREALKVLAGRAGVEIEREDPKVRSERERLQAILNESVSFYEAALSKNSLAKEYLVKRGATPETLKKFRIGFAPAEWRSLYEYLRGKKFTDTEIEKAGMAIRASRPGPRGELYFDRFRSRIMFPLSASSGAFVGFSGRIFGDAPPDTAKYVNSPQTALYDKSRVLYGYDKAKAAIREKDACVFVEGQMDLVLSHQAGVENTVAVSGTALTEDHLGLVNRLTKNLIVAFDPDAAGVSAAGRSADLALALGMEVRAVVLPAGLDPADLIRMNPEAWTESLAKSKHIISFFLEYILSRGHDPRALRLEVSKKVLPYVARLTSAIEQAHFIHEIASAISLPEEPIREEIAGFLRALKTGAAPPSSRPPSVTPTVSRKDSVERRLLDALLWQREQKEPIQELSQLIEEAREVVGDRFELLLATDEKEKMRRVFEAEAQYSGSGERLASIVRELISMLREEILKEERDVLIKRLKISESKGDEKAIEENLRLCQDIDLKLKQLKNQTNLSHGNEKGN